MGMDCSVVEIKFFEVGGCLRDKILGITTKDLDYAVEAPSFDAMKEATKYRGYKIYLETPQYLTIRAHGPDGAADFSLTRSDGLYKDGRRPESVKSATILEDLARRDFTMNAMARNIETNEFLDPHGGLKDIEARIIRAVGNPKDRIEEDKLRALRALRFSITKQMGLDVELHRVIDQLECSDFNGVSTDRIRAELHLILTYLGGRKLSMCDLFHFLDLLEWPYDLMRERGIWFKPTTEQV